MHDLQVLDEPAAAIAVLDPVRARILALLAEPGSATTVARELGLPRQRVNYHLRQLEAHGLLHLVEERPRRGLTERLVVASASGYVVSPTAVGGTATDPNRLDRLSARYLIALAARLVREVADLSRRAEQARKTLPTLAIDTEIRFASPSDQAAFTRDLAHAVTTLVAHYHDETADGGRWHRLIVAAHPRPAVPPRPRSRTRSREGLNP
ncbi:MAG: helix-turn-helix domain-containing protein [Kineosporiaceae bacterium]